MSRHQIECPFCHGHLEVDANTGKITQKWEASKKTQTSQEKFKEAMEKMEEGKKKRETLFSSAADELEKKKKKAEDLFKEQIQKIKQEGKIEKPENPFDFD